MVITRIRFKTLAGTLFFVSKTVFFCCFGIAEQSVMIVKGKRIEIKLYCAVEKNVTFPLKFQIPWDPRSFGNWRTIFLKLIRLKKFLLTRRQPRTGGIAKKGGGRKSGRWGEEKKKENGRGRRHVDGPSWWASRSRKEAHGWPGRNLAADGAGGDSIAGHKSCRIGDWHSSSLTSLIRRATRIEKRANKDESIGDRKKEEKKPSPGENRTHFETPQEGKPGKNSVGTESNAAASIEGHKSSLIGDSIALVNENEKPPGPTTTSEKKRGGRQYKKKPPEPKRKRPKIKEEGGGEIENAASTSADAGGRWSSECALRDPQSSGRKFPRFYCFTDSTGAPLCVFFFLPLSLSFSLSLSLSLFLSGSVRLSPWKGLSKPRAGDLVIRFCWFHDFVFLSTQPDHLDSG